MSIAYYKRNCPECGEELTYKHAVSFDYATKHVQKCAKCSIKSREERRRTLPPETISSILEMNANGILNRDIARTFGINHKTVAYHLEKNDKQQNWANQPIDMVSDSEAKCRKCNDVKPLTEFQFGRKGRKYEYRFSYCNKCRKQQVYLNLNSGVDKFLNDKYHRLIGRCKKLNIPCHISKKDFIDQYHKQNGKCFYTDKELAWGVGEGKSRYSISTDKIIPQYGYIPGNTVFCINKINTCKNDLDLMELRDWMPPIYKKIIEYYGMKDRIEIGDKVFVDDTMREQLLCVPERTMFIIHSFGSKETFISGTKLTTDGIVPTSKTVYDEVYLTDIRDLGKSNPPVYGPISEFLCAYPWQLLRD